MSLNRPHGDSVHMAVFSPHQGGEVSKIFQNYCKKNILLILRTYLSVMAKVHVAGLSAREEVTDMLSRPTFPVM